MLTCWRRRMILPLLVVTLLTGCQNPNNGLWIQRPAETSLPQTSQTIATLLLFSGRPNPQWVLSASQTQELLRRLEHLSLSTVEPFADGLSYQGYQVQIQSANAPLTWLRVFDQPGYSYFGDRIFWFATSEVFLVTDDHQVIAGDPCANNFTESTLWPEFFVHDLFRAVRAFYWKGCLAQLSVL